LIWVFFFFLAASSWRSTAASSWGATLASSSCALFTSVSSSSAASVSVSAHTPLIPVPVPVPVSAPAHVPVLVPALISGPIPATTPASAHGKFERRRVFSFLFSFLFLFLFLFCKISTNIFLSPSRATCALFRPSLSLTQDEKQHRHPDVEAVPHLPEIGGSGVEVHLGFDLVDPWERVEHNHVLLHLVHDSGVHHVRLADGEIGFLGLEPLLLDARHVEHVNKGRNLIQGSVLSLNDAGLRNAIHNLLWHTKGLGGDVVQANVVQGQQLHERVSRTTVLQVPNQSNVQTVDGSQLLTNRVDVKQGLFLKKRTETKAMRQVEQHVCEQDS